MSAAIARAAVQLHRPFGWVSTELRRGCSRSGIAHAHPPSSGVSRRRGLGRWDQATTHALTPPRTLRVIMPDVLRHDGRDREHIGGRSADPQHARARRKPPMTTHSLLLLPGDGIGPEVMAEVERVVAFFNKKGKVAVQDRHRPVGGASIDKHGVPLTERDARQGAGRRRHRVRRRRRAQVGQGGLRASGPRPACCGCARSSTCSPTCAPPSATRRWPRPPRCGASTSRASTS